MSEDVMYRHIDLFVNEYSIDLGVEGSAIRPSDNPARAFRRARGVSCWILKLDW